MIIVPLNLTPVPIHASLHPVVIIHKGERPSFEEEPANDGLEIITVFSARLYGSRSHKSKKILDALTDDEKKETAKRLSIL